MRSAISSTFTLSVVLIRSGIAATAILLVCWTQWVPRDGEWNFANEWLRDRLVRLHVANNSNTWTIAATWPFISEQAHSTPDSRIAIIDIDESSITQLGPWPWPRTRIAELVEKLLGDYGARGVALDIVLPAALDTEGDLRLAMLAQHGPLVLAQAFDYAAEPLPLRAGKLAGGQAVSTDEKTIAATGYYANHAGLKQAAHIGNIGFIPDQDGSLRRLPMLTQFGDMAYPTLAWELFACCSDSHHMAIPMDSQGFFRVPLTRNWASYTMDNVADILNDTAPIEDINGRLVLVGSSSLGLSDRVLTPLLANTPGVLMHAATLSALLDQQERKTPSIWPGRWVAVLFSVAVTIMASFAFARLSALWSATLLGVVSLLWLCLAYYISPHDPEFSVTGPLAANLFLLAIAVPFDWQISQRQSRHLLGTLRQYVAREVVDELLLSNLDNPLAPRQLSVTTLIADMEAYTTHVESLPMEEAARVTIDFLDCLTRPVLEMHGTLDKYTGDGLVAFWGAPLPNEDHADLALDAAHKIVQEVQHFNQTRIKAGRPPVRVRIGIESGLAMAGDFGTSFRSLYTAVGDSVNVASRLEESARDFPHDIIVGPGAVARAKRHRFIALGERTLRGKEKPTALYALESN